LFTGDSLTAGKIGATETDYEHTLLVSSLRRDILTLDPDTLIFPGHGPPTNLAIEKAFNPDLR
jgi:glyoxylase-like metal-dependent hydrolase (beta-lactamase superfamily II)